MRIDRTDEELMAAYVDGNAAAFRELFARHAPVLERVMRHQLRRPEDARDLVQQTFLQLHRARGDFRLGARVRPWLFTIAMNLRREYFRRLGRRPEAPLDVEGAPEPVSPPGGHERLEASHAVEFALGRLPEDQRTAIERRHLRGLSVPEVARQMGRTVPAVAGLLHRGTRALRELIGGPE